MIEIPIWLFSLIILGTAVVSGCLGFIIYSILKVGVISDVRTKEEKRRYR